jgi:hypothetical protein
MVLGCSTMDDLKPEGSQKGGPIRDSRPGWGVLYFCSILHKRSRASRMSDRVNKGAWREEGISSYLAFMSWRRISVSLLAAMSAI